MDVLCNIELVVVLNRLATRTQIQCQHKLYIQTHNNVNRGVHILTYEYHGHVQLP